MRIVIAIVVGLFVIGMSLDFLRLFGIRINDWTAIFWVVAIIALVKWKTIARTLHYLFARYPTHPTATANAGSAPTFLSADTAQAVRAVGAKLDADAEIAEATMRLERARMQLAEAQLEALEDEKRASGARQT